MVIPLCFRTVADFERWQRSLAHCGGADKRASHCRDCLPAYQLRMKKLGRCEHPETMFTLDEMEGIVGITGKPT